jgi:hypothetical protein
MKQLTNRSMWDKHRPRRPETNIYHKEKNMNSLKIALGTVAMIALVGCNNGQPRIYRVALGQLSGIGPACFKGGNLPQSNSDNKGFVDQLDMVIWDGTDKQYLDIGTQSFSLGDSPTIKINDEIESNADKVFNGQHNVVRNVATNYSEQRLTSITVSFNDYSTSPSGTVDLKADYACSGSSCPTMNNPAPDSVSCAGRLTFAGRRIDAQQITAYGNNPP